MKLSNPPQPDVVDLYLGGVIPSGMSPFPNICGGAEFCGFTCRHRKALPDFHSGERVDGAASFSPSAGFAGGRWNVALKLHLSLPPISPAIGTAWRPVMSNNKSGYVRRDRIGDRNRDSRDSFDFAHVPLPGHSGHPPFRGVSDVPVGGGCPGSRPDPSAPFRLRRARAEAHGRWMAEGKPWPPPGGLTSALVSRVLPRGGHARRW